MVPRARSLASVFCTAVLAGCALLPTAAPPVSPTPSPALTETAQPSATQPPAPSATIPAGPTASPSATLAPGEPPRVEGALWVANEADGNLLVIDTADNSVAVIVPTNLNPRWVVNDSRWVWALDPNHDALIQVDPRAYTVERVVNFPERDVTALAVGADAVWVAYTDRAGLQFLLPQEEYVSTGGILRLDPQSGEITGSADTGPVTALAFQTAPAFLWALARGPVDTRLLRIDPQTLAPLQLALVDAWALDDAFTLTADGLWRFSTAFGRLYHTAPDGRLFSVTGLGQHKPAGAPALLAVQGDVWLAAPWPALLRFDPGQRKLTAEIALEAPAESLAYAGGSLWAVSPLSGAAYRVDPAAGVLLAVVPLGEAVRPTPRVSPTPILRASKPCEDAPYSRLVTGMRAATPREPALPNRIHTEPGKDSEITGYILPGQSVLILEGPECKDGWVWWSVSNEINKVEGWVAEGDEAEYWLIPLK